jgi:hypothetical protein
MKGFPNQVANLPKLALGMRDIVRLIDEGENARNDGILGEALVRSGVAGTGHGRNQIPIDEYLRQQRIKPPSNQSFRTTARGLRELFELLGLIIDRNERIEPTELGRQAAGFAERSMDQEQIDFWRRVVAGISHDGGDGEASHPYQVLLRLVSQRPGISRAKCALALEAHNDSQEELDRIVRLAGLTENVIRARIAVTKANWDNAKKVLPAFAEQLGDVIKLGDSYTLADAPGRNDAGSALDRVQQTTGCRHSVGVRAPRTSRLVTSNTIAQAGVDGFDDVEVPSNVDPQAMAAAIKSRLERLRRHNEIVRDLASRLLGAEMHENPFDILAIILNAGVLVEVKTLDGTEPDERDRVKGALSQLLYYEAFVTRPVAGEVSIHKIACFETAISEEHQAFLNNHEIGVMWKVEDGFTGDELATAIIGRYFEELL